MLNHLLTQLASELQISLSLEEKLSRYTLALSNDLSLDFKELDPGFYCSSRIAALPQDSSLEDLYILCMRANFLGQGTKGSVISIDESVKHFVFSHTVVEEMNYRLFKETIEDFVNYLNYWKKRIASNNQQGY